MKEYSDKNTQDFKTIITNLEHELEVINRDNADLVQEIKTCKMKMQNYKDKLKMSSNVICKLNNVVQKFTERVVQNKKTQTEDVNNMYATVFLKLISVYSRLDDMQSNNYQSG